MSLRRLKEPICLFGEDAGARRERLILIVQKIQIEQSKLQPAPKPKAEKDEIKENELFYTRGIDDLKAARMEIALFSIPKASKR